MAQIWRSHIGFVREQTYGTTGSGTAQYMPILSYDTWEDTRERIIDNAYRAVPSKDFFVYTGTNMGRTGYTWYGYPDALGRFLKDIFGSETVTQTTAGAPGIHTFGSTDTPPSETIYDFYGVAGSERRWQGAQQERMELKFDVASGAMTMQSVYTGYAASTGIGETSASFSSGVPFRGWEGALTIAGATNNRLLGASFTLQRQIDLIYAAYNSQNPVAREVGPLEITGKLSFYAGTSSGGSTETEYTLYRGNTSTSLSLILYDPGTASSSNNTIQFVMSNANFHPATIDRGGNYVRWDVGVRALHNATDSGPASIVLTISSTAATT